MGRLSWFISCSIFWANAVPSIIKRHVVAGFWNGTLGQNCEMLFDWAYRSYCRGHFSNAFYKVVASLTWWLCPLKSKLPLEGAGRKVAWNRRAWNSWLVRWSAAYLRGTEAAHATLFLLRLYSGSFTMFIKRPRWIQTFPLTYTSSGTEELSTVCLLLRCRRFCYFMLIAVVLSADASLIQAYIYFWMFLLSVFLYPAVIGSILVENVTH